MKSMNIYRQIIISLGILLVSSSCVKDQLPEIGTHSKEYIGFSAALTATTRTAGTGRSETAHLSIVEQEWPLVSVDSDAQQTRGSVISSLDGLDVGVYAHPYKGNALQESVMTNHHFGFVNSEQMESVDDPVSWKSVSETDSLRVYGYAPYMSGSQYFTTTTTNGRTTISYTVPEEATDQYDIIATDVKSVPSSYGQNIPLTFQHILTGVRFKAGFDCTITSLKVVGVIGSGNYTIGSDVWSVPNGSVTTFDAPIPVGGKSCSEGDYITGDDEIMMMIPQQIPDDAYVELTYDGGKTIQAPLIGLRWEQGALVTYTIYAERELEYVYFDLNAGNVTITPTSYAGYVFVGGEPTLVEKEWTSDKIGENQYHYYIYQSNNANKLTTGYQSKLSDPCRLPSYDPVKVGTQFWRDYITNNSVVESVIEAWDTKENIDADALDADVSRSSDGAVRKVGRCSTPFFVNVSGNSERDVLVCDITLDNIYSRYQLHGATRTSGGLTFTPNQDYSKLIVNLIGDNRVGNVHYYSGRDKSGDLLYNNELILQGSGSLTAACVDFHVSMSAQSSGENYNADNVMGYFANYWCSAIGGDDGSAGNSIGIVIKGGTIFAGTTQAENCTAIGGGGNDRGYVTIEGGAVTAVATTTGTAIGGGIGFNSQGGIGNVKIRGGNVFAYNHANEWEIPSAAIGSAGSWASAGGSGEVEITGGYVYAQTALGTAIGGGSSKTRQGGSAKVTISGNSYVIAKSIPAIDKYTGDEYPAGSGIGGGTGGVSNATTKDTPPAYGGAAEIIISGNPTIRTGTIGGGKTNNPEGKIGHATIDISGGDISAQFVMAGGAGDGMITTFNMSGGTISNSDVINKEYYHIKNNGAAVYMEDGVFTMTAGTIRNCVANMGGAVYIKKSENALLDPEFVMQGGSIEDCRSSSHGGAVYLEGGSVVLSGGVIHGNLASNGNGGGIYIAKGDFTMSGDAQVSYNSALHRDSESTGNGGGIYVTSPNGEVNVTVESGTINNNTCDYDGGGICVDMSASSGDDAPKAIVRIGKENSGPSITNNKATMYGGGLYAIGENAEVTIDGGTIKNNRVTNYVTNEDVANEHGTVVLNGGDVTHVVVTFDVNTTDPTASVNPGSQNIVTSTNSFLVAPTPNRALYRFIGWNSRADGKGVTYKTGDLMNISEDMTLYAQWRAQ